MRQTFSTLIVYLIIVFTPTSILFAFEEGHTSPLPPCVVMTHCARVDLEVNNAKESFHKALEVIASNPRTEIIDQNDSYIHAKVTTRWMHYVDDIEIKALPKNNLLEIRSESRVGITDLGVNKKRIADISNRLTRLDN